MERILSTRNSNVSWLTKIFRLLSQREGLQRLQRSRGGRVGDISTCPVRPCIGGHSICTKLCDYFKQLGPNLQLRLHLPEYICPLRASRQDVPRVSLIAKDTPWAPLGSALTTSNGMRYCVTDVPTMATNG